MPHEPIGDYAVIGDCRSAALISATGSVDWLCLPRFDSPSVFGAILDADRGGRFVVRPVESAEIARRYIGHSNVLETIFTARSGMLRVTDLMPVDTEAAKSRELWPEHELLRKVECLKDRIRERLGINSLLYRYHEDDGLPPGEGAFGICGFWEVACRAQQDERVRAENQFEVPPEIRKRCRVVRRGNRPVHRRRTRQLPAGPDAYRAHQRGTRPSRAQSAMNVASILLWGFVATVALTAAMSISHGVGLTRISIPFLLGTILTPDRDRALVVGTAFHVVNGWMFAFLYAAMLESIGWTTWWLGAGIGLAHALFVLAVGMPLIPGFHPRMVSEITARRRTAGCSLRGSLR